MKHNDERYKFNCRKQTPGEAVDTFGTALRNLAKTSLSVSVREITISRIYCAIELSCASPIAS